MSTDCIFCKIIDGTIPSTKVFENENFYAFKDINPATPVHVLIVPKIHKKDLNEFNEKDQALLGELLLCAAKLAEELEIAEGYRTIINTGSKGGQTVFHLHLHLMGGRQLVWAN